MCVGAYVSVYMCECVHMHMFMCECVYSPHVHMVSERPQNQTGRWRTAHMDDCCLLDSLSHTLPVRRPLEILGTLGTCDKGPLLC